MLVPVSVVITDICTEHWYEGFIEPFHHTIRLWMILGGPCLLYLQYATHFCKELTLVLTSLVWMYGPRDTESTDNFVYNYLCYGSGFHVWHRERLRPFGEIVWYDQYILVSRFCLWELSKYIGRYSLHRIANPNRLHRSPLCLCRGLASGACLASPNVAPYITLKTRPVIPLSYFTQCFVYS